MEIEIISMTMKITINAEVFPCPGRGTFMPYSPVIKLNGINKVVIIVKIFMISFILVEDTAKCSDTVLEI